MKHFKLAGLLLASLFLFNEAGAQMKDPTTWTYEVRRKYGNKFEVLFHVKLENKWHIYALKPGDESMIPPSFTFSPAKNVKLSGEIKETGKPIEEQVDGIDNKIRYFKGEATFIQEIEVSGTAVVKVKGTHQYQVCNESICLPPKNKDFSISIKP